MLRLGILSVLLCMSAVVFSQTGPPKVQAGVRFGYNYSNFQDLKNSNLLAVDQNRFVMAGGFIQLRVLKKFGLRAEVLYNPKGALVNYYDSNNVKVEAVRKLNYTDVTLSAIYNFRLLKFFRFYAFAGYNFESLGSAKDAIHAPYRSTQNITKSFEEKANSIVAGLGLSIHISKINIYPEVRYLQGLTNVSKNGVETKNKVFTASLGLAMTL